MTQKYLQVFWHYLKVNDDKKIRAVVQRIAKLCVWFHSRRQNPIIFLLSILEDAFRCEQVGRNEDVVMFAGRYLMVSVTIMTRTYLWVMVGFLLYNVLPLLIQKIVSRRFCTKKKLHSLQGRISHRAGWVLVYGLISREIVRSEIKFLMGRSKF